MPRPKTLPGDRMMIDASSLMLTIRSVPRFSGSA
jgi:hypothetical protein